MTTQIEVNASISDVFGSFIDKQQFAKWKLGFLSYEPVSSIPGEVGTTTRLNYKRFVMIETVEEKNEPILYITRYNHQQNGKTMMVHRAINKFTEIEKDKTRIEVTSEILQVNGFFTKIIVKLMAKAGEKQFRDQLKLFKTMVEGRS